MGCAASSEVGARPVTANEGGECDAVASLGSRARRRARPTTPTEAEAAKKAAKARRRYAASKDLADRAAVADLERSRVLSEPGSPAGVSPTSRRPSAHGSGRWPAESSPAPAGLGGGETVALPRIISTSGASPSPRPSARSWGPHAGLPPGTSLVGVSLTVFDLIESDDDGDDNAADARDVSVGLPFAAVAHDDDSSPRPPAAGDTTLPAPDFSLRRSVGAERAFDAQDDGTLSLVLPGDFDGRSCYGRSSNTRPGAPAPNWCPTPCSGSLSHSRRPGVLGASASRLTPIESLRSKLAPPPQLADP